MTDKKCYECSVAAICLTYRHPSKMFTLIYRTATYCLNCARVYLVRYEGNMSALLPTSTANVWEIRGVCQGVRNIVFSAYDRLTSCPRCAGALPGIQRCYQMQKNMSFEESTQYRAKMGEPKAEILPKEIEYSVLLRWRTSGSGCMNSKAEFAWNGSGYTQLGVERGTTQAKKGE